MITAATPKLIGIGGMRCGSTSLHRYLTQHPLLVGPNCPDQKEVHRFDAFAINQSQYQHVVWPEVEDGQIVTENTPEYLTCPHVARKIRDDPLMGNAKFYVMLRNPINRTFSHWKKRVEAGPEEFSFSEALAAEPARINHNLQYMAHTKTYHHFPFTYGYKFQSDYPRALTPWFTHIGRARIHIIKSEDFFYDTVRVLDELCQFIGIDPVQWDLTEKHNQTKVQGMNAATHEALRQHFEPQMKDLFVLLGDNKNWYMWPSILEGLTPVEC